VNNAGFGTKGKIANRPEREQVGMLDLHVQAAMRLTQAALPGMIGRKQGRIIVVASVASFTASPGNVNYCAAVCPGFTHTEFHERAGMNLEQIPSWMWLNSADVVRRALRDSARGRSVSVAGANYRVLSFLARHAPRSIVARAAQW